MSLKSLINAAIEAEFELEAVPPTFTLNDREQARYRELNIYPS